MSVLLHFLFLGLATFWLFYFLYLAILEGWQLCTEHPENTAMFYKRLLYKEHEIYLKRV